MHIAGLPAGPERASGLAGLVARCVAACIAVLALAWLAAPDRPPALSTTPSTPAVQARMLRHVSALAAVPRPIATAANAAARAYIVEQLRGMGLEPEVQRTTVQKSTIRFWGGTHLSLGVVHNVVVRLPGGAPDRARRPALLLATHYDTGKATLGAVRPALQVAALLETARALRVGPATDNDIVLLFADGEDVGALGAQGFVERHPWARQMGLALRFDSAGSGGPLLLLDASNADGAVLGALSGAAPGVGGSSLLAGLHKLLPDTPRIGPLAQLGAPALLFANTGRRFDAERTLDTVERLDPTLPAHLKDTMLGLARHYGNADLARGAHGDHAWFAVPGLGRVQHPAILSWGLAALAGLMLARGYRQAWARSGETVAPLLQGVFGVALVLLAARMLLWEAREELAALTRLSSAEPALVEAILGTCVFAGTLYLLRRFAGGVGVFLGAMAWLLVALAIALSIAPASAYVLAWPLVAALGAFMLLPKAEGLPLRLLVLAGGLAPALLLLAPAMADAWATLAPHGVYLPAAAIAVLLACFASLFLLAPVGRYVTAGVLAACAGCLTLPDPRPAPLPREAPTLAPDRLVYFKDMNSWRAYWLLPPQPLDDWGKRLFPNLERPAIHVDVFGWHSPRQWFVTAPREDRIAYPEAYLLRSPALGKEGATREVEFTLRSANRAPHIELWAAGTKPLHATLNGRVLSAKETRWSLSLYGMEDTLLRFTMRVPADDLLAVVVEEHIPGLPVHLLPPGAPPRMPGTGTTISSDVLRFY